VPAAIFLVLVLILVLLVLGFGEQDGQDTLEVGVMVVGRAGFGFGEQPLCLSARATCRAPVYPLDRPRHRAAHGPYTKDHEEVFRLVSSLAQAFAISTATAGWGAARALITARSAP
jgi:hypothetical protein